MAPRRSRKPAATIQKKESRQAEPGARAMAGAGAAVCEVSVFTAIVGKVYLFSHDHRDGSTQTAWPQAPIPQPPTWPQAPDPASAHVGTGAHPATAHVATGAHPATACVATGTHPATA